MMQATATPKPKGGGHRSEAIEAQ